MQIHLNLYSGTLLALVDTGCNILHESCAKMELVSFCYLFAYLLNCQGQAKLTLPVSSWLDSRLVPRTLITIRSVQPIETESPPTLSSHLPAC